MARRDRWFGRMAALVALVAAAGCGGGSDASSDGGSDTAAAAEQEAAPQEQASAVQQTASEESGPVILTEKDIDLYRKGRSAEIDDVKKKTAALSKAKSETDTLSALGALTNEEERTKAGADAAGMAVADYERMTRAVDDVLGAYSVSQMMKQNLGGADTASLPEDARARVRENMAQAESGLKKLPEQNVKLVIPHAAELDSLRLLPAALALKAASGM